MDPASTPQGASTPTPGRIEPIAVAALVIIAALGAILSACLRGPEFDEFWTLAVSDAAAPIDWQFSHMWMHDAHPPLFALGSRIVQSIAGGSYVVLRLCNLLPMAAFFAMAFLCWAWAWRARAFLLCFVLLWVSSVFFGYFALARSYFIQHALVAVFLLGAIILLCWPPDARGRRARLWALAMAGLFVSVNINFLAAAICAPFLASFILIAFIQRRVRLALGFVAGGAAAYLPLTLTTLVQLGFMLNYASNDNWVEAQSLGEAISEFSRAMWRGAGQNLPFILVAFGLGAIAMWQVIRGRSVSFQTPASQALAAVLAVYLATSAILLLADQMKPFIVGQYLLILSAALNVVLALSLMRSAFERPAIFWLAFMVACGVTAAGLFQKATEPNWMGTVRAIQAELKNCRDAPVWFAIWPRERRPELEETIFPIAYRDASKIGGFEANLRNGAETPLASGPRSCAAYVWIEHMPSADIRDLSATALLAAVRLSAPPGASAEVMTRADTGVVIKIGGPPEPR